MMVFLFAFNCNSKPKPYNYYNKVSEVKSSLAEQDSIFARSEIVNYDIKKHTIDSIVKVLYKRNQFNGNLLVAQNGRILYHTSCGMADPQGKDTLNNESCFQLASVSKTITAVSVLLLYEQNYFKLDDLFSKYFPDFPYKNVTIRHLLSHRSGVPNYLYFNDRYYPKNKIYLNNYDIYETMVKYKFPPMMQAGKRFFYNNSNYVLLALLIEKMSGMSYSNFVTKYVFETVGMDASSIELPDEFWYRDSKTYGLYANNRKYPVDKFDGVYGDKGIYSTTLDLYKFDRALYPDILLKKKTLEEAYKNQVTEARMVKMYGLGFRMKFDQDSNKIIYHNGWWHGYRTAFHRRLNDNSCVIVLSNRLNQSAYSVVNDIFKVLDNNKSKDIVADRMEDDD